MYNASSVKPGHPRRTRRRPPRGKSDWLQISHPHPHWADVRRDEAAAIAAICLSAHFVARLGWLGNVRGYSSPRSSTAVQYTGLPHPEISIWARCKLARLLYRNWGPQGPHWRHDVGSGVPRSLADAEDVTAVHRPLSPADVIGIDEDRGRAPYKPVGTVEVKPVKMPRAIVQHTPLAIRLTEPITYLRGESKCINAAYERHRKLTLSC